MGKLNYLTVTQPDLTYHVSAVSLFLSVLRTSHWDALSRILQNLKHALSRRLFYSDYDHGRITDFSNTNWAKSPIIQQLFTLLKL